MGQSGGLRKDHRVHYWYLHVAIKSYLKKVYYNKKLYMVKKTNLLECLLRVNLTSDSYTFPSPTKGSFLSGLNLRQIGRAVVVYELPCGNGFLQKKRLFQTRNYTKK